MQVYAALRDAIVRAELEPGRRLSENELAGWLAVSRTPVREALARLRDERLVDIVPQLGTYVTRISPRAVADAQFVREALECAAIRRSAERASDEDIAVLEDNLRAQERAQQAHDWDSLYLLDDQFHRVLCDASGHATVWLVSQRAKGHLNRVRRLSIPRESFIDEVLAEHRLIIDAVSAHDTDLAERELRQHL
jgi:DNA-binding GntR family transcriptional regulator